MRQIIDKLPHACVSYAYEEASNTHFVEIKPTEVYRHDAAYVEMEIALMQEFTQKFPYEVMVFVEDREGLYVPERYQWTYAGLTSNLKKLSRINT